MTTKEYIEKFLKIKTKDMQIIPFKLNKPQLKLYNAIKEQAEKNKKNPKFSRSYIMTEIGPAHIFPLFSAASIDVLLRIH